MPSPETFNNTPAGSPSADTELLAQNSPPPSPFPAKATTPAPAKAAAPKWKSDGTQWVALDGSGTTKPFTADDYIKALPANMQAIANKLRNFDIPYPAGQLSREAMHGGGPWTDTVNAVAQDPDWTAADYDAARKTKLGFAGQGPTEAGGNINAMNTAVTHVQAYKNAAKELGNTNVWQVPIINNLAGPINRFRDGDVASNPKLAKLAMAEDALSGELTKVFRQGAGASSDVEGWKKNLGLYNAQESQNAAADAAVELISNRIRQLRQSYLDAVHRPPSAPFLRPDARAILQRAGYDPDAVESGTYSAKGGLNRSASSGDWKAAAQSAKPGAVILLPNGHQVRKNADGTFTPITQ